MIEVLCPRRSRGLLSSLGGLASAPMYALVLAMATHAASLPMFLMDLPEYSTTHFFRSPLELGVGGTRFNLTQDDAHGLTDVKTAPAIDDRCGRDLGWLSTRGVIDACDATPLNLSRSFSLLSGPPFLSNFVSPGPMELMVHPTAWMTPPDLKIRLDSLLCDLMACCIIATSKKMRSMKVTIYY